MKGLVRRANARVLGDLGLCIQVVDNCESQGSGTKGRGPGGERDGGGNGTEETWSKSTSSSTMYILGTCLNCWVWALEGVLFRLKQIVGAGQGYLQGRYWFTNWKGDGRCTLVTDNEIAFN